MISLIKRKSITFILVCTLVFSVFFSTSQRVFALEVGTERTFLISAYYSPLPDQEKYVFGSYELDKKVNGQGIAGADGTPVYVGMIAAPKSYPFGTKISIPGLGIGCVHDRGGAIIAFKNVDRLDIWMGYGDEGRKRAMNWGMRTIVGTFVAADTQETLTLSGKVTIPAVVSTPVKEKPKASVVEETPIATEFSKKKTLQEGNSGQSVLNLQQFLYDRGFMEDKPTGYFGEKTKQGVILFQEFYRIIPFADAPGAGIFGPKTRAQMEAVWNENINVKLLPSVPQAIDLAFTNVLEKGVSGDEVKKLQRALQGLGYFTENPNGVFGPATQKAVMAFQKDHLLIADESSVGAGILGPKTGKKLLEVLKVKEIKIIAGKERKGS